MALVSAVVAGTASTVVLTNAWDARQAMSRVAPVEDATDAADANTPAREVDYSRYPQGQGSGSWLLGHIWPDPPLPDQAVRHLAMPEVVAFLSPPRRPGAALPTDTTARLSVLRPSARPEDVAAGAAGLRVSLIPRARPGDLDTSGGAIGVARATGPEEELVLARLDDAAADARPATPVAPRMSGSNPCGTQHDMPRRARGAASGSAVLASVGNGSGSGRDGALVAEALRGNMPSHLRQLQPVRFSGLVGGRQTDIVICVTPDYLAIGSDSDHVRVPLGLPAALEVADAFDMILPTTRMVDAIYAQADLRLSPRPMTPGPQMSSTDYFARHDATLDAQLRRAGGRDGLLVAGHKKDVVLANRLSSARGRVAIYGWHRSTGDPIQPLSTVHGAYYADYSHGIRLVSRTAYIDGRAVDLRSLLTDRRYAGLLNSDGPLNAATVRLASL